MWIGIVTALPQLIEAAIAQGVVGRALANGRFDVELFNIRDYGQGSYAAIDDRPFGGAPGMLMMAEPLAACTETAIGRAPVNAPLKIYLSPQGDRLTQDVVRELASHDALVLISGRYEGVDERFVDEYVDRELSIGDYVVSGGELPALVLVDAIGRLADGALGNASSASDDSFGDNLLEGPQYTRPRSWRGNTVPEVLISGNHEEIARWRKEQALKRTWQRRPDLLTRRRFTPIEKALLKRISNEPS